MTDVEFKEAFSERLRALRKASGLSQQQLGEAVGFSDTSAGRMIQKWERRVQAPNIRFIKPLLQTLHCSIDDLLP